MEEHAPDAQCTMPKWVEETHGEPKPPNLDGTLDAALKRCELTNCGIDPDAFTQVCAERDVLYQKLAAANRTVANLRDDQLALRQREARGDVAEADRAFRVVQSLKDRLREYGSTTLLEDETYIEALLETVKCIEIPERLR